MEPAEIQARATLAAALIMTRAVEVPSMPEGGDSSKDVAALRLRDLTDYVYRIITTSSPADAQRSVPRPRPRPRSL
jgi:hypothetical protein